MITIPAHILAELRRRHADPRRASRGWGLVEARLRLLGEVAERLHDPVAVRWALLFHDAGFDPLRGGAAARSAALLDRAAEGCLPAGTRARAVRMLHAAGTGTLPEAPAEDRHDAGHLHDIVLALLGADDAARFDDCEAAWRRDHAHLPPHAFLSARGHELRRLLTRPRLYLTDWGRARFEAAARRNLHRAVAAIEAETATATAPTPSPAEEDAAA